MLEGVDFPMIESATDWVMQGFSYPNYLADLRPSAQSAIFENSSVDGNWGVQRKDIFRS